jgi:hypothetical protein
MPREGGPSQALHARSQRTARAWARGAQAGCATAFAFALVLAAAPFDLDFVLAEDDFAGFTADFAVFSTGFWLPLSA